MQFIDFLTSLKQFLTVSRDRRCRRARSMQSATAIERIESRRLLTTTLFLDFGAAFPSNFGGPGAIQATVEEIREIDGPGINGFGTGPDLTNTGLTVPLELDDQVTLQPVQWDYSGDGIFTTADINQLAAAVGDLVADQLAPFDIDVALAGAASLADVSGTLSTNDTPFNQAGRNDVYSLVTVATSLAVGIPFPALANSVGNVNSLFGLAAADDLWGASGNQQDEATLTFSDRVSAAVMATGAVPGTDAGNASFSTALANVVTHEAMHTFGLEHVANAGNNEALILSDDFTGTTIGVLNDLYVTRFPLTIDGGGTDFQNPYEVLRDDPDIGLSDENFNGAPDFAYITGTGAHDRITISQSAGGAVSVSVIAFADAAHQQPIRAFSYQVTPGVDTEAGLVVLAGGGSDVVTVQAGVELPVTIDGGSGSDSLNGGSGNDLLDGGAGSDTLQGGQGDDQLDGGAGEDLLVQLSNADLQILTDSTLTGTGTDTHSEFEQFTLQAGAGDNTIDASGLTLAPVVVMGGAGNDVLIGGSLSDQLHGEAGQDALHGNGGEDHLWGGDDIDRLYGGNLADILDGGPGNDQLYGGNGDDTLYGWDGNDLLRGQTGNDELYGGGGEDTLWGDFGNDLVVGDGGDDLLYGTSGVDSLWGSDGNDTLFGGFNDDLLVGGNGHDSLDGESGRDTLTGNSGNDILTGGSHTDRLDGGSGDDLLDGGSGDDYLDGEDGHDTLLGHAGNDRLYGGNGHDLIHGGDGSDTLHGGAGDDVILGGNGHDQLHGDDGDDVLLGESGDDTLNAGHGDDVLYGGPGADSLVGIHGVNLLFATRDDRLALGHNDQVVRVNLPLPATRSR